MATYVNDLRLKEIATGDESGTWGTSTNTNLELIAEAFSFGTEAITTNADTHTTTIADGSTDPGRSIYLKYTGTLDSACTITIGPNTVSKLWFIENGTSGSQNIIISQGSGANVTIPPGDTKAIYSDGAGSGAAMVDAFASLNVVDLKVEDDLTVTDDLIVNGDIDLEGSIDVNGTANLDVVDIDGAVDMASTLAVTGIVTLTDDLIIGDGKTIGSASDVDAMTIASNGQVTFSQTLIGTALDISGDIDVDGTTNLDVVDIDGAVDMASTLAVGGAVTANAGVVIDNITIDGTEIDLSSGDLTLDSAGDIILDADGADILLKDAGTTFGELTNSSTDFVIKSTTSDKDILFKGNDGGSAITALTLDMSDAGTALFNNKVGIGTASPEDELHISDSSGNAVVQIEASASGFSQISLGDVNDGDVGKIKYDHSDNSISFTTDTSERMRINSSGNLLLGTATVASANAAADDFVIKGSGTAVGMTIAQDSDSGTGTIFFGDTSSSSVGGFRYNHNTGDMAISAEDDVTFNCDRVAIGTTSPDGILGVQSATGEVGFNAGTSSSPERGNIYFDTDGSGWCLNIGKYQSSSFTALMTIKDNGNIGLGTETLDCKLNIVDASTPIVRIKDTTNNCQLQLYAQNSDAHIGTSSNHPLIVDTNDTERLRLDSNGNFLFATTSSSTNANGIRFFPTGSSGGCFAEFYNGDDGQAVNIGRNSNGTVTNFINGSSTVGSIALASGTTYNTSSDARLKDVTGKARGLEVIGQLNPVAYNWKESGQADEGLIAQEIEELVPNAVNQDEDGYYQMDYSKLVVHLIKAVQEQQEQIESLTSEIANLKGG